MWNLGKLAKDITKSAAQHGGGNIPNPNKAIGGMAALLAGGAAIAYGAYNSLYTVEGGHRAVMFKRIGGVQKEIIPEGTHIRIPWFETPTIFDIRTKPKTLRSPTGTKDLQTVDITLRVLYKPNEHQLSNILSTLGTNFSERVLPSIVNETLKSVIAQYNASQLITQRDAVSRLIKRNLMERAKAFDILVDDVSITHLTFGKEYTAAIEAKQVAQQEAERAKFVAMQALQDKRSTIIKGQAESKSAEMIGQAVQKNPGFIELRQLDAAKQIASTISRSNNKVYLDSSSLMLNINPVDAKSIKGKLA
jgi:prohibitin 2